MGFHKLDNHGNMVKNKPALGRKTRKLRYIKLLAFHHMSRVIMQEQIKDLICKGINPRLFSFISDESIEIHRSSYLGKRIHIASQKDLKSSSYSQLHALGVAINDSIISKHRPWVVEQVCGICREITGNQDEISVISKNAAELIASGLLSEIFGDLEPLVEAKNKKTPDLSIGENSYIEVYCPQDSQPEKEKVKTALEGQSGMVRAAISHPITGSGGKALTYPANKIIDKVLNHKWSNDQTVQGAENILWLDLMNGFEVSSLKVAPYESLNHAGHTYIGSFGIWHSFYGEKDKSLFAPDRFVLKYGDAHSGFYCQHKDGIFRSRVSLSAALVLTTDGVVLLENPWASNPINESTKQSIRAIYKFRPEYSYFGGVKLIEENEIESVLSRIEWLYGKS